MKLVDKIKNMFTEEVEEEKPVIKKEVMHVEINAPKVDEKIEKTSIEEEIEEIARPVKEEKPAPIFFDDTDFDALEKPKIEKPRHEEEKSSFKDVYKTKKQVEEQKPKTFKPSPIISPVYGILDKNYKVDDIEPKKVIPTTVYYEDHEPTIDEVRKKAYGTLEDDIETTLFGKSEPAPLHEEKEELLDDLLKDDETDTQSDDSLNFDDFEVENEKDETHYDEVLKDDLDYDKESKLDDDFDLSDDIMNSYDDDEQTKDENISDSDLFDLIDSMYEKGDE